ncbi:tetratricopeptide repeat protein [Longispora urticae]
MPHVWITGERVADRAALAAATTLPGYRPTVDAHRRLRGPYTMAGEVFRTLVPVALERWPELVHAHDIELLSVAPELRDIVPATRETLTSLAVPRERTRFYSRLRTLRLGHGLAELLRDHLIREAAPTRTLVVENVDHADQTDVELLTILLRRLDPELLTLVVCTGPAVADEGLASALARYAEHRHAPARRVDPAGTDGELAAAYVASDGTSDVPALLGAYQRLEPAARAALHDARAAELEGDGEWSWALGAIPYHREHGADPAGAGARALHTALEYTISMGFYHATLDYGERGRALVDWSAQEVLWWAFTSKMTTSLMLLSRAPEAEALYDEARSFSLNPVVHRRAAYATAMIHTRHHEVRDHHRAKAWIHQAIILAELMGEGGLPVVFQQNGLALIELHLGDLPAALRLVDGGMARLDRELDPEEHRLHRSVLLYNRAQILAGMGRTEDALVDYAAVIAVDPNYPEYHFDTGNLLHSLGRDTEALAAYAEARRLSPTFGEVYYNRADVLMGLGEWEAAVADLGYLLELDPGYLDAYVNRAGALAALGRPDEARADADSGLAIDPDNPYLHCLLGDLHAEEGRAAEAEGSYAVALRSDPGLAPAWAGRAALAYAAGDLTAAAGYLDRALEEGEDAALLYNRATIRRELGRVAEALADLDRALELAPGDPDTLRERELCLDPAPR